jgi:hypothetical protein
LPDRVSVSVSVVVSVSGRVTRAEVAAPGLPERDVDCLRGRANGLALAPSDDETPRTARTTIEVERRPAEAATPARTP